MKKTKTILWIITFSVMVILQAKAQTPGFEWAVQMGGDSLVQPTSIAIDADGNQVIIGTFRGTADFDPDPDPDSTFSLTSNGWGDIFIQKLDVNGNLLWASSMGDMNNDRGAEVVIGDDGNIYATGYFWGTIDADPGDGVYELSQDRWTTMVLKINPDGDLIWGKQFGSGNVGHAYGWSIAIDNNQNVITSGYFYGRVDFNPGPGTYNLTCTSYDTFIQKLDANGNFIWAKQIGGTAQDLSYSIALDPSGFLYTTGYFSGTADFNPGTGTYNMTSTGSSDAYILKLDLNGNFIWAKQLGGPAVDCGGEIALDNNGNVYISGYFYSTGDFDPGTGTSYLTSNGHADSFVFKSDSDGDFLWVIQTGGPGWDYGMTLALDGSGNIFNVGRFEETADFDPGGNNEFELSNVGEYDMFVQKLNPTSGDNCPVPAGLVAANITETSADLGWAAVSGVGGYYVRYRESGVNDWIVSEAIVTGTTLTISGLTAATPYEFQVKTDCYSNYSYSGEFLTAGVTCPDNYEPNETMGTAAAIPVNTDITALINAVNDLDWFSFSTTNAAKNVRVTLTNLPANYDVVLYKSNGTQVGISQNTGTTGETIIYNTNKAGSYYIKVYGAGGAYDPVSCYTLKAATSSTGYKSAEAESFNADVTEALTVYPNPSNSTFNFIYKTNSPEPITLQLFDISGRLVQEFQSLPPNEMVTVGENLENGIYVTVVTQGAVKKFVKIAKVQ